MVTARETPRRPLLNGWWANREIRKSWKQKNVKICGTQQKWREKFVFQQIQEGKGRQPSHPFPHSSILLAPAGGPHGDTSASTV